MIAGLFRTAGVCYISVRTVEFGWICKGQIMPLFGLTGIWLAPCLPLKQPLPFPLATCSQACTHIHKHASHMTNAQTIGELSSGAWKTLRSLLADVPYQDV